MYSDNINATITNLCEWVNLPRSVYYYKHLEGKPGARPSTHTLSKDGELVTNELIIDEIKKILERPFADWGYEITAAILKREYIINEKKVYRLMNENNLLLNRHIKTSGIRKFVKYRTVKPSYPMEYLSMDIKYIWVAGEKRNYYQLSIIDVYSKRVLNHILKNSIRKKDVVDFLKALNDRHCIKGVKIRNDNGPQFIAGLVKNFLRFAEVEQEFSHPATPEENCYIEAFHSIMQRAVIDRYEFDSYYEAKVTIERFIEEYNNFRPHRSIGMRTPRIMWDYGMSLLAVKQQHEQFAENLSRPDSVEMCEESASYSLDKFKANAYICEPVSKDIKKNMKFNLNLFENNVQLIGG